MSKVCLPCLLYICQGVTNESTKKQNKLLQAKFDDAKKNILDC